MRGSCVDVLDLRFFFFLVFLCPVFETGTAVHDSYVAALDFGFFFFKLTLYFVWLFGFRNRDLGRCGVPVWMG